MYRQNHPLIYVEKAANSVKTKNIMLDVGCGTGQLWKPFSPIFQKIYGIDVSDSQLATARDAIQDLTNIRLIVWNNLLVLCCIVSQSKLAWYLIV